MHYNTLFRKCQVFLRHSLAYLRHRSAQEIYKSGLWGRLSDIILSDAAGHPRTYNFGGFLQHLQKFFLTFNVIFSIIFFMATYSHSIALVDTGGGYSLLGTQALSVGDTIQLTVSFGSGWTAGSSDSITETGGWPVASPTPNQAISSGGSAVWSYTVEEEDPWGVATNGRNLHIHFFGDGIYPNVINYKKEYYSLLGFLQINNLES